MRPARGPAIVVIGEVLLDVFPEASLPGGAPFNVAAHLALLGEAPLMLTRIGDDAGGARLAAEFAALGLATNGLQVDPTRPTGTARVVPAPDGHRFEIADDVAWDAIDADRAIAHARAAAPSLVCFGTLAQRAPASRAAVRGVLESTAALRVLDLNLRGGPVERLLAIESLALADVVKASVDELATLLRWHGAGDDAARAWGDARHVSAVRALMQRHDIARLVVTRGADGWACFDAARTDVLQGAPAPVKVVDTVGAGDAFIAVLLLGLARGWPLRPTLDRAGDYAASVCTHRGAFDRSAAHGVMPPAAGPP